MHPAIGGLKKIEKLKTVWSSATHLESWASRHFLFLLDILKFVFYVADVITEWFCYSLWDPALQKVY